MNRAPGESAEQWSARAAAEYYAAWDALGTERRRRLTNGTADGDDPVVDEGYDSEIDRLEVADRERGAAAIAVDRVRRSGARADRMRADVDRRMTAGATADQPAQPGV